MAKVIFRAKKLMDYYEVYYQKHYTCFNLYSAGDPRKFLQILENDKEYTVSSVHTQKHGARKYMLKGFEKYGFLPAEWFEESLFSKIHRLFARK